MLTCRSRLVWCALVNLGVKTNRLNSLFRGLRWESSLSLSALVEKTEVNKFAYWVAWTVANLSSRFLKPCANVASWIFLTVPLSQSISLLVLACWSAALPSRQTLHALVIRR
jgi:hypothetical protein